MPTATQLSQALLILRKPKTCRELADGLGMKQIRAREVLDALRRAGLIEPSGVMVGKQNRWRRTKERQGE